jgi:hypothetical protein
MVWPGLAETWIPLTLSPAAVPLPPLAETDVAVTAPPKRETFLSVTAAPVQPEPLAYAESKVRYGWDPGYSDAPSPERGRATATVPPPNIVIAATPAPTQPFGRGDAARGAYVGVGVVVVVGCVVVVAVVVVSVVVVGVVSVVPVVVPEPPSARATAAATAAPIRTMQKSDTARRI